MHFANIIIQTAFIDGLNDPSSCLVRSYRSSKVIKKTIYSLRKLSKTRVSQHRPTKTFDAQKFYCTRSHCRVKRKYRNAARPFKQRSSKLKMKAILQQQTLLDYQQKAKKRKKHSVELPPMTIDPSTSFEATALEFLKGELPEPLANSSPRGEEKTISIRQTIKMHMLPKKK